MTDSKKEPGEKEEQVAISRRKLVYVAPALMSKRMFYRAATCNKALGDRFCGLIKTS
ncbi:MAG TPA: hypothetical protein VGI39_17810 [Polyangiaceae bacterium]|jgi:hypothetical protein